MSFVRKMNLALNLFKSSFCIITLLVDNYCTYSFESIVEMEYQSFEVSVKRKPSVQITAAVSFGLFQTINHGLKEKKTRARPTHSGKTKTIYAQ